MGRKPCKFLSIFGRSNQRAFSAKSARLPKTSFSAQLKGFFLEGGGYVGASVTCRIRCQRCPAFHSVQFGKVRARTKDCSLAQRTNSATPTRAKSPKM